MGVTSWRPANEDELRDALVAGDLHESHTCEFKRELAPGPGGNRELARDLAQFAIDGGTLFIGVAEQQGGPPLLNPMPLEGLQERVDQIARSLIDPPLPIHLHPIVVPLNPMLGYLVIVVPPSTSAPHMVDGRYYGRGEVTRLQLNHAEVERLIRQRTQAEDTIFARLAAEIARDPTTSAFHRTGHLFVLAQPVLAPPDLLLRTLGPESSAWCEFLLDRLIARHAPLRPRCSPDLGDACHVSRRANGWAVHTWEITPDRRVRDAPDTHETDLLELEVSEDGALRLFCTGATYPEADDGAPERRIVVERLILGMTKRIVVAATLIASTAGWTGSWDLGVAITNMHGGTSLALSYDFALRHELEGQRWPEYKFALAEIEHIYPEPEYRAAARISHEEMGEQPDTVVMRLLARLNRILNDGRVAIP